MELSERIARELDKYFNEKHNFWIGTENYGEVAAILDRHLSQSQWQPIENAPRTWEWFLGYSAPEREYAVYRIASSGLQPDDWIPTHWMPLPSPPAAAQAVAGEKSDAN